MFYTAYSNLIIPHAGAKAVTEHNSGKFRADDTINILPYFLDDVGCNGLESNLLNCLPSHNCRVRESAGVQCIRKGSYKFNLWQRH
jgi:hypothetical protein